MVKASTCRDLFAGHCNHWHLTEAAHAIVHAQQRLVLEIGMADMRAGLLLSGESTSSVVDDGPRLEALLADEGYAVVPLVRA